MSLQVGGAVLGVAVLTVIDKSVQSMKGGQGSASARRKGYQAAYYGAVALSGLAALLSFFTAAKLNPLETNANSKESTGQPVEKAKESENGGEERETVLEPC